MAVNSGTILVFGDYHELNVLQHMCLKRIQHFKTLTLSDMCEAMLGINTVTAEIDRRKLIFLQKLCDSHSSTISSKIFHHKISMFSSRRYPRMTGFVPDIYRLLNYYGLTDYIAHLTFRANIHGSAKWTQLSSKVTKHNGSQEWTLIQISVRFLQVHENINNTALPYLLASSKHELKAMQVIAKINGLSNRMILWKHARTQFNSIQYL